MFKKIMKTVLQLLKTKLKRILQDYKYDKESIEKILAIIIEEASPKSNKINLPAWDLLNLFIKKSEQHIDIYLSKRDGKDSILNKNTISSKS